MSEIAQPNKTIKPGSSEVAIFSLITELVIVWQQQCHLISTKREWNNCFIKNAAQNIENSSPLFVKTTDFQLVLKFEQSRTVTIFGEHGIINNYSSSPNELSESIAHEAEGEMRARGLHEQSCLWFFWRYPWHWSKRFAASGDKNGKLPRKESHQSAWSHLRMTAGQY